MSVKKNRRPSNPIMRKIDDSIDWHENKGAPVDVQSVASNVAQHRLALGDVIPRMESLLAPFVRTRLTARGYKVTDSEEFDRTTLLEMGVGDFDETIKVKQRNVDDVQRHLIAEKDVRKYMAAQRTRLGREVTVSEFEDKVVSIYERHGISV